MIYHKEKFEEISIRQKDAIESVQRENSRLDNKAYSRYKKDLKDVEESIERAKREDSQKAAENHMRLKHQMDLKERQRSELL